jgi:hypothetical protein
MRTRCLILLACVGLLTSCARKPTNFRWEVNEPFAAFKGSPEEQQKLVDAVLKKTARIDSMTMFIAADTAFKLGRLEDSAFLLQAARFRSMMDMNRFPPKSRGSESPGIYLSFLSANAGQVIAPAAMEKPEVLAAVGRRFAAWDFNTIKRYNPGWEYTNPSKPTEDYKARKDEMTRALMTQAELMQDTEYANLFKSMNDFVTEHYAEILRGEDVDHEAQAKYRRDHARMVEIETAKGVEGFAAKFSPDALLNRGSVEPDITPSIPSTEPEQQEEVTWPALSLTGVLGSGSRGSCMINGKVVAVGEEVDGVKIIEIKEGVVAGEFQGECRILNVTPHK